MPSYSFRVAALAGVASSIVVLACSSGSGTSGGGPPVPMDQLGKAYVDKICAAIQTCCNQNGFTDEYKTCSQGAAAAQASFDKDRAAHPDYTYDAQKAGNCIAKLANAYGTCDPKTANIDNDPDCDGSFRGSKPAGATCSSSGDCAALRSSCAGRTGSVSSDGGTSSTDGVCVTLKAPAEGDPCFAFDQTPDAKQVFGDCQSDPNFYCDTASKTCKARGGAGTTCVTVVGTTTTSSSSACNKDATCDFTSKACVARKAVGESCSGSSSGCVSTAYCDAATKKCVGQKAPGETCQSSEECAHGCDTTSKKCRANGISRQICSGNLN